MVQVKDTMRPQVNVPPGPGGLHVRARCGERASEDSQQGGAGTEGLRTWGGASLGGMGGVMLLTPPGNDEAAHQRGGTVPRVWLAAGCWDSSLRGLAGASLGTGEKLGRSLGCLEQAML